MRRSAQDMISQILRASGVRAMLILLFPAQLIACATNPPPLKDLLLTQSGFVSTARGSVDDSLRSEVNHYLRYLNDTRERNARGALKEKLKFNVLSVIAIGLGTTAAIVGFVSEDTETKAKVSGVSGAGAAFLTSLIAKFRHSENAQQGATCAKLTEKLIETFVFPDSRAKFDSVRTTVANQLNQVDCLAPELR